MISYRYRFHNNSRNIQNIQVSVGIIVPRMHVIQIPNVNMCVRYRDRLYMTSATSTVDADHAHGAPSRMAQINDKCMATIYATNQVQREHLPLSYPRRDCDTSAWGAVLTKLKKFHADGLTPIARKPKSSGDAFLLLTRGNFCSGW